MAFEIYNSTHQNLPLGARGIKTAKLASGYWAGSERNMRLKAYECAEAGWPLLIDDGLPLPYDIRVAKEQEVLESIRRFKEIIAWARRVFGRRVPVSIYRSPPTYGHNAVKSNKAEEIEAWKRANEFLNPLAEVVDWICPSIYAIEPSVDIWVKHARASIAECRKYNKKVLPFLMPQSHPNFQPTPLAKQPLPPDFWRVMLEVCLEEADGIILYIMGPPHVPAYPWRDAWYNVLTEFVRNVEDRERLLWTTKR